MIRNTTAFKARAAIAGVVFLWCFGSVPSSQAQGTPNTAGIKKWASIPTNGVGDALSAVSTADGSLAAVVPCCSGLTIQVHRTSDGALIRTLTGHAGPVQALAFSKSRGIDLLLASADETGVLKIWRIRDSVLVQTITVADHAAPIPSIHSLAFSPDDTILAEADAEAIRMYATGSGALLATIPGGLPNSSSVIDFTSDGRWLMVSATESPVRLWGVPDASAFAYQHGQGAPVTGVAHSPTAGLVGSSSADGTVQLRSAGNGSVIAELTGHAGPVNGVAFSPAGDLIATAGEDATIKLWSTADHTLLRTLTGHSQAVRALAFSPDGTLLASGSADPEQLVKLWSVDTGTNIRNLSGADGAITSVAFAPDGQSVVAASDAGVALRWSIATGSTTGLYLAPSRGAMSLTLAPHGQRIVAGWADKILVFDTGQGSPLYILDAHEEDGTSVAYAPDGARVIAGGSGGVVKIWDAETWTVRRTLNPETEAGEPPVSAVFFSPDDDHFVYGRGDGMVVFAGTDSVAVPSVVGMPQELAAAAISNSGLLVGTVTTQPSTTVPTGSVISQSPAAGTQVNPRALIDLVLSDGPGPPQVAVPAVIGMTQAAAASAITAAGLVVGSVTMVSSTVTAGNVIVQNPSAGAMANPGSPVDLVVSTGLDNGPVSVPAVIGLVQSAARAVLTAAGLVVGAISSEFSATVPAGNVISQNPPAGAVVNHGSPVSLIVSSGTDSPVIVPNVVGMTQAAATAAITNLQLVLGSVLLQNSATVPAGSVISQDPEPGTPVARRSTVDLLVSIGPGLVTVPDVVGMTQAGATTALTNALLFVGVVTTSPSTAVPAGSVISQSPPPGAQANPRASVDLVISSGPGPRVVPNVVGMPRETATTALAGADLLVGAITMQASMSVPLGSVISQNPAAGSIVSPGSTVDLVVSTGPPRVAVPDVVGLSQAAAAIAIEGAGLVPGGITQQASTTVPAGHVISQNPVAGTQAIVGSPVDLVLSSGPPLVAVPNVVGLSQVAAATAITGAGLVLGNVSQQASTAVPSGHVIAQNPVQGTQAVVGSAVDLVVSSGLPQVTVPNVVGQPQASASAAITGAGLVVGNVTTQASSSVPAGHVISQNPAGGTQVNVGSGVALVVSSGPQQVAVPNVVGQTQASAATAITGAGLVVGNVTTQASSSVPAGHVISQNPVAGTQVNIGSGVALVVSSGPQQVAVPNVVGQTQSAASTAITGVGLAVGSVTTQASASVPAGRVISQNPVGGTPVNVGSVVNLVVSSGPPQVAVPNVVGFAPAAATAAITGAGLVVGTVTAQASATVPAGHVISQNPVGGTQVNVGSAVDLVVASGPRQVALPYVVGLAELAATMSIRGAGLALGSVTTQFSGSVPAGHVISQNPAGGMQVNAGSSVDLVVSSGPPQMGVPQVVGLPQSAAAAAITGASFVVGSITSQASVSVPAGHVISQNPVGGSLVNSGTAVNLVVSTGSPQVPVPYVVSLARAAALTTIAGSGLAAGAVSTQASASVPEGAVISQSPAAGTMVPIGSLVHLVVSSGPLQVVLPSLIGQSQSGAAAIIASARLVVGSVTQQSSDSVPAGQVIAQSPTGGSLVPIGSAVNLVISSGPAGGNSSMDGRGDPNRRSPPSGIPNSPDRR